MAKLPLSSSAASRSGKTRVALRIAYDGTRYGGWARQGGSVAKGYPSVQEVIEEALGKLLGESVMVEGAGRTDAGVHASDQCAHFDTASKLDAEEIGRRVQGHLPVDIQVWNAKRVSSEFHARGMAVRRQYVYLMSFATAKGRGGFADVPVLPSAARLGRLRGVHSVEAMLKAVPLFVGEHDYRHLSAIEDSHARDVRGVMAIEKAELLPVPEGFRAPLGIAPSREAMALRVTARAFLKHQVRYIVGALSLVGRGKLFEADIKSILKGGKPPLQIDMALPNGLTLEHVDYGPGAAI
jgi:tRNA pseudouridine38-40 synthase